MDPLVSRVNIAERLAKARADAAVAAAEMIIASAHVKAIVERAYDEAWLRVYGPDSKEDESQ